MPDTPRELKIHRLDGSFGFVLRGHNPVRVESILPGGPADKARLSVGDAILGVNSVDVSKCSHSHLIQLLQSSGSSPTLKVAPLRVDDIVNGQCSSELSGPSSWGWMSDGPALVMDGTAKTFREMADHLLTPREKSALRQALLDYKANRDVTQFVLDASEVLDTPSKCNLWHFLLPRMSQAHQKYVRRHVTIPQSHREDTYLKGSSDSQKSSTYENTVTQSVVTEHSDSALSYLAAQQGMRDRRHLGSFRQQLGYLLTSRERLLLKKALQIYAERRNVYNLLGDLMEILDTPSKKSLWVYIIPLLSVPHQRYCQTRLGLPEHVVKTDSVKLSRSGAFNIQRWRDMDTSRDRPRLYNRPASLWRKANGMDSSDEDMDSVSPLHNLFKPPGGHLENNRWSSRTRGSQLAQGSLQDGEQSTITCAPIYAEIDKFNNQRSAPKQSRIKLVRDSSAQTTPPSSPPSVRAWSRQTDRFSQTGQRSSVHGYDGPNSDCRESSLASIKENGSCCSSRHSKVMRGHNGDCSQATTVAAARNFDNSYEAYQMKAMNAIQALDDAVANETGSETEQMVAPPAPPAPPPLPPGLPPSVGAVEMKVKRLNWEKIDVVHENSVWAQMGDTDDLEDIVKYLELEQQFSTKRNRVSESFRDRKNEVVIISPKKAYNISILLGHMRMSVADIRQALTQMDESILTPELLKQMLAYAPDANEMEKYDAFKGSLCELSKPDQFVYQMSRLPGYEQRLKAMLFKANFAEKVEEVKKNLKCIKRAAQELQQSSKLTRILELVLAMGNRLNHGNPRVAQATAFRVNYLAMLDLTKTTDGKASFLHVLVDTVSSKFADSLRLSEDLPTVLEAARISNEVIAQELSDLRKVLQEISATVNKLSSSTQRLGDRFHEVMEHFISEASDEIQGLFSLQASTTEEFTAAINYFGDDPKKVNTCEFFNIFAEFITKFEVR
ncbi:hypothetical protein NP493_240g05013 [Ridgeia piscesae]|uniref:Delphilin n=1 Tax=Ridgeia piscesae TaxID=27915 RepID=A0AAD9UDF6_RIDPI|nr:hypothetical protein NP493_240g05013 [Ridgeia piscesae]